MRRGSSDGVVRVRTRAEVRHLMFLDRPNPGEKPMKSTVRRGLLGIECHVVRLVLEVAPGCEGDDIHLLLDRK